MGRSGLGPREDPSVAEASVLHFLCEGSAARDAVGLSARWQCPVLGCRSHMMDLGFLTGLAQWGLLLLSPMWPVD